MKKLIVLVVFCLALHVSVPSQETESQILTKKSLAAYQLGNLPEAIEITEKVIVIETNRREKNWQSIATAEMNVALFKKEHYWLLRKESELPGISVADYSKNTDRRYLYRKSVPEHFRKVIEICEKQLAESSLRLVLAKIELASFLSYYDPATGFRLGRDLLSQWGERKNKDGLKGQTEKLYLEGFQLQKKLLGESDDSTIVTGLVIGNFYFNDGAFEEAAVFYQDFARVVEKKFGAKSQFLISALRPLLVITKAAEMDAEANGYLKRIEAISGQPEAIPGFSLDLTLMCKTDELNALLNNPDTISQTLKKQKWLLVNVWIDEKGNVIEAKAEKIAEKDMFGKNVSEKAERSIRDWKFRPFLFNSVVRKIRGTVWFPYLVKT